MKNYCSVKHVIRSSVKCATNIRSLLNTPSFHFHWQSNAWMKSCSSKPRKVNHDASILPGDAWHVPYTSAFHRSMVFDNESFPFILSLSHVILADDRWVCRWAIRIWIIACSHRINESLIGTGFPIGISQWSVVAAEPDLCFATIVIESFSLLAISCLDHALEVVNGEIVRLDSGMEKAGKWQSEAQLNWTLPCLSRSGSHQSII